jgi:hypothetical protein
MQVVDSLCRFKRESIDAFLPQSCRAPTKRLALSPAEKLKRCPEAALACKWLIFFWILCEKCVSGRTKTRRRNAWRAKIGPSCF